MLAWAAFLAYNVNMLNSYSLQLAAKGKIIFPVRVQPQAKQTKIVGILEDGSLKVAISAPPADNKANEMLCKLLAQEFNVKKEQVSVKSGASSRYKLIMISAN